MNASPPTGARAAHRVPDEELGPQTLVERQESLSQRILRMQRRRRERFLRRSQVFSLRQEALRTGFLVACLVFDALVVPEPVLLLPSPWGWAVAILGLVAAVYLEYRIYARYFGMPPSTGT